MCAYDMVQGRKKQTPVVFRTTEKGEFFFSNNSDKIGEMWGWEEGGAI